MRTLPVICEDQKQQIEAALNGEVSDQTRVRLMALRMVGLRQLTAKQIAEHLNVSRASIFIWLRRLKKEGVEALAKDVSYDRAAPGLLEKEGLEAEFLKGLEQGRWRRAKDVQAWVRGRGHEISFRTVYGWFRKYRAKLKVPRKSHVKKDPQAGEKFKASLAAQLQQIAGSSPAVRLWVVDEHRYGLIPVIRRAWGLPGVRLHAPYKTCYKWGYLHEAMEIGGHSSFEYLFTQSVNLANSSTFLEQIARSDPKSLHVVIWDGAGFHPRDGSQWVPQNVRLLNFPAYSPELNPVEKLGDLVKDRICNRVYPTLLDLESEIHKFASGLRQDAAQIAQLIGSGWLLDQANDSFKT